MTDTTFGLTCPKCQRLAQAEVMRARDEQPRQAPEEGEPVRLDQLPAHLLDQVSVDMPPSEPDYPTALVAAFGRLETAILSVDLGALIRSQEDAYDRVNQTEYTIRELLWLARWQTRELAHAARELASTREQLTDANNAQLRIVKGGDA
jgi:hypothetical protein